MGEICGAVEGIDDPEIRGWALVDPSPLLSEEAVIGITGTNHVNDTLLCRMIRFRNQVDWTLVVDPETIPCIA